MLGIAGGAREDASSERSPGTWLLTHLQLGKLLGFVAGILGVDQLGQQELLEVKALREEKPHVSLCLSLGNELARQPVSARATWQRLSTPWWWD